MSVLRLFGGIWRKRIDWPRARASAAPNVDAAANVETRLLTILEMVNEWLQFAEAKNAGLVALDGLGLAAILTILPSSDVPDAVVAGLMAASLLLLLSLGLSLWSFLPRHDAGKLVPRRSYVPRQSDNLYFYGDISNYRPEQLAAEIARRYERMADYDPARHRSHVDLAGQIVANSRITVAKNGSFRMATMLAMLALAAATVGLAIALAPAFFA
jgi:hypothetical protein